MLVKGAKGNKSQDIGSHSIDLVIPEYRILQFQHNKIDIWDNLQKCLHC